MRGDDEDFGGRAKEAASDLAFGKTVTIKVRHPGGPSAQASYTSDSASRISSWGPTTAEQRGLGIMVQAL
jgi:hypothetical protein